ncbi:MAG: hypothetical protein K8T26_02480 [Lentisphaerae bacterium]|nr:hypothetical protein [Lentisphaerota bacterium]
MKTPDPRQDPDLHHLLQAWTAPAPRENFETSVRARLQTPAPRPAMTLWDWHERLIPRLVWATAGQMAIAAAVALMVASQIPTRAAHPSPAESFARTQTGTVTHAYWELLQETR